MIHTENKQGDVEIQFHGAAYELLEEASVIAAKIAVEAANAAQEIPTKPVSSVAFLLIIMGGALDLLEELDPHANPSAAPGLGVCTISAPELKPVAMPQPVQRHRRRRHSGVRTAAQ